MRDGMNSGDWLGTCLSIFRIWCVWERIRWLIRFSRRKPCGGENIACEWKANRAVRTQTNKNETSTVRTRNSCWENIDMCISFWWFTWTFFSDIGEPMSEPLDIPPTPPPTPAPPDVPADMPYVGGVVTFWRLCRICTFCVPHVCFFDITSTQTRIHIHIYSVCVYLYLYGTWWFVDEHKDFQNDTKTGVSIWMLSVDDVKWMCSYSIVNSKMSGSYGILSQMQWILWFRCNIYLYIC